MATKRSTVTTIRKDGSGDVTMKILLGGVGLFLFVYFVLPLLKKRSSAGLSGGAPVFGSGGGSPNPQQQQQQKPQSGGAMTSGGGSAPGGLGASSAYSAAKNFLANFIKQGQTNAQRLVTNENPLSQLDQTGLTGFDANGNPYQTPTQNFTGFSSYGFNDPNAPWNNPDSGSSFYGSDANNYTPIDTTSYDAGYIPLDQTQNFTDFTTYSDPYSSSSYTPIDTTSYDTGSIPLEPTQNFDWQNNGSPDLNAFTYS